LTASVKGLLVNNKKMQQITNNLLMIRPKNFSSNNETLLSNDFQNQLDEDSDISLIRKKVDKEFQNMTKCLTLNKIEHCVFDDTDNSKSPDSIFPNNWVTFHSDGKVILYPMMSIKRRNEKRLDIIDSLSDMGFIVSETHDLSYLENQSFFLEGTGSMILDRPNRRAYACISSRTSNEGLKVFSEIMNYEVIAFNSITDNPIYHTNVIMNLGEVTALVCFEAIKERELSERIRSQFEESERTVIDISIDQMNQFLGNALEVRNKDDEKYLLMSDTAKKSMNIDQRDMIEERLNLLSFPIPTIEKYGGGSVRCMLAEIFLDRSV